MKNITIAISLMSLLCIGSISAQENKKVWSMIEFFQKYDGKEIEYTKPDGTIGIRKIKAEGATMSDFNKLADDLGYTPKDKDGVSREQMFQFFDLYIREEIGDPIDRNNDNDRKDGEENGFIDKEKQKAETIFNNATTDDKMNHMMKDAESEIKKMQSIGITYEEFRKSVKEKEPNASESEIKKAYDNLVKQFSF